MRVVAQSEALLLDVQEQGAEEEIAVNSAALARLLHLDPATRLRVPMDMVPMVQLIDPHDDLEKLIQIALFNRPEIGAQTADMVLRETRLRQERVRPLSALAIHWLQRWRIWRRERSDRHFLRAF